MKAPPFIRRVAASGTCKTLKPICWSTTDRVANAVVLPAHGPPVRQMRVIGCFDSFRAFLASKAPSFRLLEARVKSSLSLFDYECVLGILEFFRLDITLSTLSISSFILLSRLPISPEALVEASLCYEVFLLDFTSSLDFFYLSFSFSYLDCC